MSNMDDYQQLTNVLGSITSLKPDILFREDSPNILISWEGTIPDEETTSCIQKVLKQFGTPVSNCARECNFVSFVILR